MPVHCVCCGCSCDCTLEGCLGSAFNGAGTKLRTFVYSPAGGKVRKCHRLFIWNCAYHDGTKYIINEKCLKIIRTTGHGTYNAYDGPFYEVRRGTSGTPGALLDTEPYWWASCGIGGWERISSWWRPTEANLTTIYNLIAAEAGVNMPAINERHTLILYVRFWRWEQDIFGVGPTNGSGVGGDTTDEDSNAVLLAVHLTCPA